jgi:hypothetical protein
MPPTFLKFLKNSWRLFKSDVNRSLEYFKKNVENTELIDTKTYVNSMKQPSVSHTNTSYIYHTNETIYNNIKSQDGVWKFRCFFDGRLYNVYNVIFIENDIVIFLFDIENPKFIVQCFAYMEIYYIGYIKSKRIIQINHSTSGSDMRLNSIEKYLKKIENFSKIDVSSKLTKQFLFFGFCGNVGHHLFNEVSGLIIFLNNPKNFSKINGICIGPYDVFNIKDFLKNNYNFNIISLNNNAFLNMKILPIFLNSFILDKNTVVPFFNKILSVDKIANVISNKTTNNEMKLLTVVVDIRTVSRILENIVYIYANIIKLVYHKYCKKYVINIIFIGRFKTNVYNFDKLTDKECNEQINVMNSIINTVNIKDVLYTNLIGEHILFIMNCIKDFNFSICIGGTCISNLMNWIYRKKTIALCNKSFYVLVQDMQYDCLQNYEAVIPPIDCVTDTSNGNFIINYIRFYPFLLKTINSYEL